MKGLWRTGRGAAHVIFQKDLVPSCCSVVTGRAPAPSGELGCRDPPLYLGHVLRDSWHPEAGTQVGVWDQHGTLGKTAV